MRKQDFAKIAKLANGGRPAERSIRDQHGKLRWFLIPCSMLVATPRH